MISPFVLDVSLRQDQLAFQYGPAVIGPDTEFRRLDAIRPSLLDPQCSGPDPVYGIAMDVARASDLADLKDRMLLYGIVAYAAGKLGDEPVRSQGHVHAIAPHSGWSPPELFEILEGNAIVYAQRSTEDAPGECIAVTASEGDKVVVPPGWAHCVINADTARRMVFGAWCDRQYGFVYEGVRRHGGLAWFPIVTATGAIEWLANPAYQASSLEVHAARVYPELGLTSEGDIYLQFLLDPESVQWVSDPARKQSLWGAFRP